MQKPEFYEERNLEHDLIIHLCRKAKGIGGVTAAHIASHFHTVAAFTAAAETDLLAMTVKGSRPLLKPEQAAQIIERRDHYLPPNTDDLRQLWITALVREFVERALDEIASTDFDALLINPFLIRAFNFTDHREVVTFCFYQKVTRSIVTSWGFTVERILLVSGGKPVKGGFDIQVDRDGKQYFLHIMESPGDLTPEVVQNFNANMAQWQGSEPEDVPDEVKEMAEKMLLAANISRVIEDKRLALIAEFEARYGQSAAGIETFLPRSLQS